MKDILHRPERQDNIESFIKKLKLKPEDEVVLINKYCLGILDKIQIHERGISARYFYKLHNQILIKAYDALKRCIHYNI